MSLDTENANASGQIAYAGASKPASGEIESALGELRDCVKRMGGLTEQLPTAFARVTLNNVFPPQPAGEKKDSKFRTSLAGDIELITTQLLKMCSVVEQTIRTSQLGR